jgi:hypothetical protein
MLKLNNVDGGKAEPAQTRITVSRHVGLIVEPSNIANSGSCPAISQTKTLQFPDFHLIVPSVE